MGTKTLYIDHNLIDEDLINFPVAIDLTDKVSELCNDLGENKYKFKVSIGDLSDSASLLFHSDNPNGSTDITDSSFNNYSCTLVNNIKHSTDQAKFGGSSLYFDGSSYIQLPDLNMVGATTFTVDCWVYLTTTNKVCIFSQTQSGASGGEQQFGIDEDQKPHFYHGDHIGDWVHIIGTSTVPLNTWTHVACILDNNEISFYLNGQYAGGGEYTYAWENRNEPITIGHAELFSSYSYSFQGYIDEFRLVVGSAVWTENFTPLDRPYDPGIYCYTEIECWETLNKVIHTKIPLVSSTTDTKINLEWDAAWDDNTTYIGETGSDAAKTVWDSNYVAVYHMAQDPTSYKESATCPNQRLTCFYISPDGTKAYMSGSYADEAYEYTLSTPFDLSTSTLVTTKGIGEEGIIYSIFWSQDGMHFYLSGSDHKTLYHYTASTAWDLSTISLADSLGSIDYGSGGSVSSDGTKLSCGRYIYTLSTPYSLSGATVHSDCTSEVPSDGTSSITTIHLSLDGTVVYVQYDHTWEKHTLTTPWDFTTISTPELLFKSHLFSDTRGGYCDGTYVYYCDSTDGSNHRTYQFDLTNQILDSTQNSLHGISMGDMTSDNLLNSDFFGKCFEFDGIDDRILLGKGFFNVTDLTLETFAYIPQQTWTEYPIVGSYSGSSTNHYGIRLDTDGKEFFYYDDNSEWDQVIGTSSCFNKFEYIVGRITSGVSADVMVNGIVENTDLSSVPTALSPEGNFYIGKDGDGNSEVTIGKISEVRFSKVPRSNAWIKATNYLLKKLLVGVYENVIPKALHSQIHIKDFISPTKYQLTQIGRRNEVCFCSELQTLYIFVEAGNIYEIDGLKVLQTGQGGDTRWVGIAGKYNYYE